MENKLVSKKWKNERKIRLEELKKMFEEEAEELGIKPNKLNLIRCGGETIYNPDLYEFSNYWVQVANKIR